VDHQLPKAIALKKNNFRSYCFKDFDLVGSTIDCLVPVSDNLFIGNEIEFEAHISTNR
jgi:hypothetical protein